MSDTADRVLDAAGRCFAKEGVRRTSIADVAGEAGVSRPTVYRWFADRDALHAAFVEREAARVGADVAAAVAGVDDPQERLVAAVLAAVAGVRSDPTLAAWFDDGAAVATGVASASPLIGALSSAFAGDDDAGRWLVRVVLSLLSVPALDEAEERRLLERFVAPVLVSPWRDAPAGASGRCSGSTGAAPVRR